MTTALDRLFQPGALRIEFQPILAVRSGEVELFGYEALTRGPEGTNMARADVLFEYARRMSSEIALDLRCLDLAISEAAGIDAGVKLTFNVHLSTVARSPRFIPWLIERLEAAGIDPHRVILEIVEHSYPEAAGTMRPALAEARSSGLAIAVDDLGRGNSNYGMVLEAEPEYLKLDRLIVQGCATDSHRLYIVKSLVALAQLSNCTVIAEGVERRSDFKAICAAGVMHVQGWLFAPSLPRDLLSRERILWRAAGLHQTSVDDLREFQAITCTDVREANS